MDHLQVVASSNLSNRIRLRLKNVFILFILTTYFSSTLVGQRELIFKWDKYYSPITSSENLLSIHNVLYEYGLSKLHSDSLNSKFLNIGYRLAKTVLIEAQLDYLMFLLQHEVFGHGYRYRLNGRTDNSYTFNLLWPYGSGDAFAFGGMTNKVLGQQDKISQIMGGVEGTFVFARKIKARWNRSEKIKYYEVLPFLFTHNDLVLYTFKTKFFSSEIYNDVLTYLVFTNEHYGFLSEVEYQLTLDELFKFSLINAFNQYNLFAAYAYTSYLLTGKKEHQLPMLNFGEIRWHPSLGYQLTPYGGEFVLDNYLGLKNTNIDFYIRISDQQLDASWGIGGNMEKKLNSKMIAGVSLDFWDQPSMELGGISIYDTGELLGFRILGNLKYVIPKLAMNLDFTLGYKTKGYFLGESLNDDFIFRIGIGILNN